MALGSLSCLSGLGVCFWCHQAPRTSTAEGIAEHESCKKTVKHLSKVGVHLTKKQFPQISIFLSQRKIKYAMVISHCVFPGAMKYRQAPLKHTSQGFPKGETEVHHLHGLGILRVKFSEESNCSKQNWLISTYKPRWHTIKILQLFCLHNSESGCLKIIIQQIKYPIICL